MSAGSAVDPLGLKALGLKAQGLAAWLLAGLAGIAALAVSSRLAIPMVPVPITLQTLAVTLIGALYGWRLGAAVVTAWLALAALGLPLLSGGAGGLQPFTGPTAGYLFAFPLAAALTGGLADRGWIGARPWRAFLAMLAGNAVCLALGAAWLSLAVGPERAILSGAAPFLPGAVIKSAAGAAILWALIRRAQQRSSPG